MGEALQSHLTSAANTRRCDWRREQGTERVSDTTRLQPHSANTQSLTRRARAQEVLTSRLRLILLPSQQVTPFQATVGAKNCPAGRSRLKRVSRMLLFIRKKNCKIKVFIRQNRQSLSGWLFVKISSRAVHRWTRMSSRTLCKRLRCQASCTY